MCVGVTFSHLGWTAKAEWILEPACATRKVARFRMAVQRAMTGVVGPSSMQNFLKLSPPLYAEHLESLSHAPLHLSLTSQYRRVGQQGESVGAVHERPRNIGKAYLNVRGLVRAEGCSVLAQKIRRQPHKPSLLNYASRETVARPPPFVAITTSPPRSDQLLYL